MRCRLDVGTHFNEVYRYIYALLLLSQKLELNATLSQTYTAMKARAQGYQSLLSIGEDNLQFYPNFAQFSTLGG